MPFISVLFLYNFGLCINFYFLVLGSSYLFCSACMHWCYSMCMINFLRSVMIFKYSPYAAWYWTMQVQLTQRLKASSKLRTFHLRWVLLQPGPRRHLSTTDAHRPLHHAMDGQTTLDLHVVLRGQVSPSGSGPPVLRLHRQVVFPDLGVCLLGGHHHKVGSIWS